MTEMPCSVQLHLSLNKSSTTVRKKKTLIFPPETQINIGKYSDYTSSKLHGGMDILATFGGLILKRPVYTRYHCCLSIEATIEKGFPVGAAVINKTGYGTTLDSYGWPCNNHGGLSDCTR